MQGIETRTVVRKLTDLKPSNVNARNMTGEQFQRLVRNLKHDGVLTSVPLVYRDRIISGHHRVAAAVEAGIEEATIMEIVTELPPEHLTAIQLSHNSLTGQDDPNVLLDMLASLGPIMQDYASVPPPDFEQIKLAPSIRLPPTVQILIEFLPEEADELEKALDRISKAKCAWQLELEPSSHQWLDTLFAVKTWASKKSGAFSIPGSLLKMAELAQERLDQIDAEQRETAAALESGAPTPAR